MFHNDLIFRDIPISEELEEELDSIAAQAVGEERDTVKTVEEARKFSWDELLADDDENDSENDL